MKCNKCGQTLPKDSVFCHYCGGRIASVPEPKEESLAKDDNQNVVTDVMASYAVESAKAAEANKGIHNQHVGDPDFGLVPEKPIYTKGINEQEKYLKSLRTIDGKPVKWSRRGCISVDGINGLIDVYDISVASGEYYNTLYINMYGADNSTVVPKGFSINKPSKQVHAHTPPATNSSPRKKSKAPVIITIILASVIILLAGILGGLTLYKNYQLEQEYEEQYAKVKQRMLEIDDWNYVTIDTLIRDLPEDYRDVSEIKTECNQISKYMTTIKNATYTEKGCEEFRKAYANLIVFNENNHDWDLSACIDSVYESSYGGLIFGKEWKDADSYHNFYWHIANDEELLITNLPSDRDDKKDYFFYSNHPLNPTKFGYENQNDTNDKFDAYEILDVYYKNGKWHMKIYCFSDSHTYLLE